jgi:DNA-binding transcriptional regulator YbjK
MAKNDTRRHQLSDAAIAVLARDGARGLTHRAVDAAAGAPLGTTSNYFRTRQALVAALMTRIEQRLAPDSALLAERATQPPGRALFAAYLRDLMEKLLRNREVMLALFELRLESTRNPAIAEVLYAWQQQSFAADVAFTHDQGLPGDSRDIALFHYAFDGLLLDRLTRPIEPDFPIDEVIDRFVKGLLPDIPR